MAVVVRHELRLDPQPSLRLDVLADGRLVAPRDELQEAERLEAALAPDHGVEIPEDLQALKGEPRLGHMIKQTFIEAVENLLPHKK